IAMYAARIENGGSGHLTVIGVSHTGSGTNAAMQFTHFDNLVPSGRLVKRGARLDGIENWGVAIHNGGMLKVNSPHVDAALQQRVLMALREGHTVWLHLVVDSKTGVQAPSPDMLNVLKMMLGQLESRFGERVFVTVDAAQGIVSPETMQTYLNRGWDISNSASKNKGASSFAATGILTPPHAEILKKIFASGQIPTGLKDFVRVDDFTAGVASGLDAGTNPGHLLRGITGVYEMTRLGNAIRTVVGFGSVMSLVMSAVRAAFKEEGGDVVVLREDKPFYKTTSHGGMNPITSFSVQRGGRFLAMADLKELHRWVNHPIGNLLPADAAPEERDIADFSAHLGQPVEEYLNGEPADVLRLVMSGPIISRVIEKIIPFLAAGDTEGVARILEEAVGAVVRKVVQKIRIIQKYRDAIAAKEAELVVTATAKRTSPSVDAVAMQNKAEGNNALTRAFGVDPKFPPLQELMAGAPRALHEPAVAVVTARVGETDGVSLEIEKWLKVLKDEMGITVRVMSPAGTAQLQGVPTDPLNPRAAFPARNNQVFVAAAFPKIAQSPLHPDLDGIRARLLEMRAHIEQALQRPEALEHDMPRLVSAYEQLFETDLPRSDIENEIRCILKIMIYRSGESPGVLAERFITAMMRFFLRAEVQKLKQEILSLVQQHGLTTLISENVNALPLQIPLAMALKEITEERPDIAMASHEHDYADERPWAQDGRVTEFGREVLASFLLRAPHVVHVPISKRAAAMLQKRVGNGLPTLVVPNVDNFGDDSSTEAQRDSWNQDLRRSLGLAEDDILWVQPTRVIRRKGIELALKLIQLMKEPKLKLVITGGDDEEGYRRSLEEYIQHLGIENQVVFMDHRFGAQRGWAKGEKVFTLDGVYVNAKMGTYPSTFEGFGNALFEMMARKMLVVVYGYKVYRSDISTEEHPLQLPVFPDLPEDPDNMSSERLREICESPEYVAQLTKFAQELRPLLKDRAAVRQMVEHNHRVGQRYFSYETLRGLLSQVLTQATDLSRGTAPKPSPGALGLISNLWTGELFARIQGDGWGSRALRLLIGGVVGSLWETVLLTKRIVMASRRHIGRSNGKESRRRNQPSLSAKGGMDPVQATMDEAVKWLAGQHAGIVFTGKGAISVGMSDAKEQKRFRDQILRFSEHFADPYRPYVTLIPWATPASFGMLLFGLGGLFSGAPDVFVAAMMTSAAALSLPIIVPFVSSLVRHVRHNVSVLWNKEEKVLGLIAEVSGGAKGKDRFGRSK
ncbi:MAG: glycosyltransferase family 4 protein, partial [Elusimicrobia bacterium]|nr:glycosyltransferase family 4 protein [Elusimicrobiota bacterium]